MEMDFQSSDHVAMEKNANNVFHQNALHATVFKLQVILPIMEGTEKSESSYYPLSYWDGLPSLSYGKSS